MIFVQTQRRDLGFVRFLLYNKINNKKWDTFEPNWVHLLCTFKIYQVVYTYDYGQLPHISSCEYIWMCLEAHLSLEVVSLEKVECIWKENK